MDKLGEAFERIKVHGEDAAEKIRQLIHEGNVRRIIVRDERGHTYLEIPLTVASIGVIAAPVLAAVGALAALVARFDIEIERVAPNESPTDQPAPPATDPSVGATENKVDMAAIVPQRVDRKGTHIEDIAGTGKHDAPGG
jgi:hypothetical protein